VGKIEIDEARDDEQSTISPPGRIHSTREENCPNKRSHCKRNRCQLISVLSAGAQGYAPRRIA
jgi:hypothetical protein